LSICVASSSSAAAAARGAMSSALRRPNGPTVFHLECDFAGTTSQMITPITCNTRPEASPVRSL
jgi:hypothetical protein